MSAVRRSTETAAFIHCTQYTVGRITSAAAAAERAGAVEARRRHAGGRCVPDVPWKSVSPRPRAAPAARVISFGVNLVWEEALNHADNSSVVESTRGTCRTEPV